ncbi:hypothetical protein FHT85_005642 [Rhizobium sp. BK312]|uniref:hypothetical protein n=1 Tax=Rhizobium sp. BK312 TaxID=2587080 RepID=UPI0017AECDDE|nr:hypothetical protein [Rhizobium sp. BK312]MBB3428616.1 hypothetical protein [Rhizobium sp. BK312]
MKSRARRLARHSIDTTGHFQLMNILVPNNVHRDQPQLSNVDVQLLERLNQRDADPDFWSSRQRDRSDSGHRFFQYPAMMVPVVQRRLIKELIGVQSGVASIYDPFMGSGTTLVSGMHFGLSVYGTDINPLAVLISQVRTAKVIDGDVGRKLEKVVKRASADGSFVIETDIPNIDKWFKPEVAVELSRLRRAIRSIDASWARKFFWVALAETVRLAGNDRTSTYKLHVRPADEIARRDISPIVMFQSIGEGNIASLTAFREALRDANTVTGQGSYVADSRVRLLDVRGDLKERWMGKTPFDLVMTSPPYGDNHTTVTYGQHSYLPLAWIDFEDIDREADQGALSTTHEIDSRSLGGRGTLSQQDTDRLFDTSPSLKVFVESLSTASTKARNRLFRFYHDFSQSISQIAGVLRRDGYMIWTVGNRNVTGRQVPTDEILKEMLEGVRCAHVVTLSRQIHHKRMPTRNATSATMREEKILIVRKSRD